MPNSFFKYSAAGSPVDERSRFTSAQELRQISSRSLLCIPSEEDSFSEDFLSKDSLSEDFLSEGFLSEDSLSGDSLSESPAGRVSGSPPTETPSIAHEETISNPADSIFARRVLTVEEAAKSRGVNPRRLTRILLPPAAASAPPLFCSLLSVSPQFCRLLSVLPMFCRLSSVLPLFSERPRPVFFSKVPPSLCFPAKRLASSRKASPAPLV